MQNTYYLGIDDWSQQRDKDQLLTLYNSHTVAERDEEVGLKDKCWLNMFQRKDRHRKSVQAENRCEEFSTKSTPGIEPTSPATIDVHSTTTPPPPPQPWDPSSPREGHFFQLRSTKKLVPLSKFKNGVRASTIRTLLRMRFCVCVFVFVCLGFFVCLWLSLFVDCFFNSKWAKTAQCTTIWLCMILNSATASFKKIK